MRVSQSGNNPVQSAEVSGSQHTKAAAHAKHTKKAGNAAQSVTTDSGDANATISSKGKELAQAKSVATNAADIREEKIAELKRRIAAGKYNVDSNAVADRLVDDHLKTGIS
jgi:negative regulator of flagellin synthesis FlgM